MIKKFNIVLFIPLMLFVALVGFFMFGLKSNPGLIPSAFIGKPIPQFDMSSLQNPEVKINNKQLLGRLSLVNIWASWCVSCYVEHPMLVSIAREHHIPIFGVDYKDNREKALAMLKKYGNPYKAIIFDKQGKFAMNLGVYGTPETFLLDKKGIIRFKYIGPVTEEVWQRELQPEIRKLQ